MTPSRASEKSARGDGSEPKDGHNRPVLRRALLLLPLALLAGCGGHSEPSTTFESVFPSGQTSHFVLDATVRIETNTLADAMPGIAAIRAHAEGELSPTALHLQGTAVGLSGRIVLRGRRLVALRELLRGASWMVVRGSRDPRRAAVELELTGDDIRRFVPGDVPPAVRGAHVTATVVLGSPNLRSSSERGS